ncbi:hypothetical protein H6S82_31885 [Planktothrix sp. FACHB-1355]|uniref:Uncharacterized protein n=1 Tax=Aerosakkonema funiforme FACHB-1375 TaxID=2949571 RepID=A0A926ZGP8_9CYAN|nr:MULTISPECIES: hypothetical protein [Oscillatoriales]MBD2181372.1 hypothetical protein [Aerosakkonema funiforme FACHB-1375]MBD3563406.1 hypothetical protein [Planktothrix sp. FACHB-1355]
MSAFGFDGIKTALSQALEMLPDWQTLNPFDKGKVIDQTFKSILKDLMQQFGMKPGIDYVDNLRDNERSADFVALSKEADDLIIGLLNGKIIAITQHSRVSKLGNKFTVKAHFRKK